MFVKHIADKVVHLCMSLDFFETDIYEIDTIMSCNITWDSFDHMESSIAFSLQLVELLKLKFLWTSVGVTTNSLSSDIIPWSL